MDADEQAATCALWRIPGLGPKHFDRLIERFGSASRALAQSPAALKDAGIRSALSEAIANQDIECANPDLDWARDPACHLLFRNGPGYPKRLGEIADPPPVLFAKGDLDALNYPQLAIVGSRHPSSGGTRNAHDFAEHFAANGFAITSGLALGIDAAAHRGALHGNGLTIAVVGHGPDRIYPAKNKALAEQIVDDGLILTEYPIGVAPQAKHFPRRNRLISGMSLGVLVVEAALRSGSLITAKAAMDQSREVFAIPGSIHNPMARGCHALIRQGAKLVESADDVIEEIGALIDQPSAQARAETDSQTGAETPADTPDMDDDYQALLKIMGYDPITIDALVEHSGLNAGAVSSMLLMLELKGIVGSAPGGTFVRINTEET